MLAHETGKNGDGLLLFPLVESRVDHGGVQHLAGGVHHGHLAAVPVSRIEPHGHKALYRGLHEKGLQVQGEVCDGTGVGPVGKLIAHLPLDGGENQPVVGILGGGADKGGDLSRGLQSGTAYQRGAFVAGEGDGGLENALLFAPVDGQNLVIQQPGNGLTEVVVEAVNAVLLRILRRLAGKGAPAHDQLPQRLADVRVIGKILGDDVICALQGFFCGVHPLFRVKIIQRQSLGIPAILGKNRLRQRLQPLLPGDRATGTPLLLIGSVQVFHLGHSRGGIDGGREFRCQLALIFDGLFHLVPAILEITQVGEPGFQGPEGGVVHGTVHFLPVPGNKGDGVALVDQAHHIFHIFQFLTQFLSQNFRNGLHCFTPLV